MKGRLIVGALAAVPMLATAVAAQAADMGLPVYKAAPTPLQTTNWSGLYFGGHAGAAWGSTNDDFNDPQRLRRFAGIPAFRSTAPRRRPDRLQLAVGMDAVRARSGWKLEQHHRPRPVQHDHILHELQLEGRRLGDVHRPGRRVDRPGARLLQGRWCLGARKRDHFECRSGAACDRLLEPISP